MTSARRRSRYGLINCWPSLLRIDATRGGSSNIEFVPGVPIPIEFALDSVPPATPSGTRPVGYIRLKDNESGKTALDVPIDIGG